MPYYIEHFITFDSSSCSLFSSSICWVKPCLARINCEMRLSFSSICLEYSPVEQTKSDALQQMAHKIHYQWNHCLPFSLWRQAFWELRSSIWCMFSSFLLFTSDSWSSRLWHIFSRVTCHLQIYCFRQCHLPVRCQDWQNGIIYKPWLLLWPLDCLFLQFLLDSLEIVGVFSELCHAVGMFLA